MRAFLIIVLALTGMAGAARAQTEAGRGERIGELHALVARHFANHDMARAEKVLRELVEIEDENFVNWYNLACALAGQGEVDQAAKMLRRAVEHGFIDLAHMEADAGLAPIRDHPVYAGILANWDAIVDAHLAANVEIVQRLYDPRRYELIKDESLRIAYYTAFDPESFSVAREEVYRIAQWAATNVFEGALDAEYLKNKPWVVVILPTRQDFARWAARVHGPGAINAMNQIGGQYAHDEKRLIAQDLGSTLRHEFLHVLHWRDAMHHGQRHPVWIQEGLCSLIEDYDIEGGRLVPAPSWRTNTAARLARAGHLMHIRDLADLPREIFTGHRPLAHYAQARAFFLFLHREGELGPWYRMYLDTYGEDPTGILAVERVFGEDIDAINEHYHEWARSLPLVPQWNHIPDGFVSIGVEVNPGTGDGPVVQRAVRREALAAGLRAGDVITAIDGRPTRDVHELLRVLADYEPGNEVTVTYRRRDEHAEATVVLGSRE